MTLAHEPEERAAALETALGHDSLALVEAYVAGARDLEVSVLGNDPARLELYGPGEIVAGHEFYDYAAKYQPGLSQTSPVAEVDAATRATILKIARDAYRAIGAEGFARVDFLLGGSAIYLSEINTIPGFTPISLFPVMAAAGGYTFGDGRRADRRARRSTVTTGPSGAGSARRTCPDERPSPHPWLGRRFDARGRLRPARLAASGAPRPDSTGPARSPCSAMILAGLALYGANASSAFGYRRLDVVGAGITPRDDRPGASSA